MKSKALGRRWDRRSSAPLPERRAATRLTTLVAGLAVLLGAAEVRGQASVADPRFSPLLSSWRLLSAQRRAAARGLPVRLLARYGGDDAALAGVGAQLMARAGQVVALELPLDALPALAALPGLQEISVPGFLRPRLDRSAPLVGATTAHERLGLDGTGTFIGVVDTGIDWRHDDFRRADGTSRLRYLLDFSLGNDGRHNDFPHPLTRVYDSADLDAALAGGKGAAVKVESRDRVGHGTHVAGVAAGNGRATGNGQPAGRYVGMAPGAELIVVQGTRDGLNLFCDADVLAGVAFILERATALDRPVVVNLSLGGQVGGHDGTHSIEQALEAMANERPGRAIVVAAGNEGNSDLHASGQLGDGALAAARIPLRVPEVSDRNGLPAHVAVEVHYLQPRPAEGPLTREAIALGPLQVTLISPSGERVGPVIQNQTFRAETDSGEVAISHLGPREDAPSARQGVAQIGVVVTDDGEALVEPGVWTLELEGRTPRFDAWVVDIVAGAILGTRFEGWLDPDIHLGVPAAAESVISVGAFGSRESWVDVIGQSVLQPVPLDRPSVFTSFGPTRDGRLKPDLVAPGEYIASSLSVDAPSTSPTSAFYLGPDNRGQILVIDDGQHALLRGSSQAAPHVAGAAALLLQVEPTLDARGVRDRLRAAARIDPLVEGGWSPSLGAGRLQVDRALLALMAGGAGGVGELDPATSSIGVARDLLPPDGALRTQVLVVPRDADGNPLGPGRDVEVRATAGNLIGGVSDSGHGTYTAILESGERGQTAVLTARVDGVTLAGRAIVHFGINRAEPGAPFTASGGGGCQQAGAGGPTGWTDLLAVGLALLFMWGPARLRWSVVR